MNEWTQSDLMKLLNPDYNTNKLENSSGEPQDTLVNNSLYWNGGEGQCYNDQNNSTIQCSFDDNNKMPESLKNIIEEITWNTGSIDSDVSTKLNTFYNLERSSSTGKICDESAGNDCDDSVERTTSWQGKVGLIYPSDFGYATSGGTENTRTKCFETGFSRWSNYNECYNNDWLKPASGNMWTISPSSYMEYTFYVFRVRDIGGAYNYHARYADDVRPSVYLSTNVVVLSGDGSYREPYTLGLEA